MLAYVSEVLLPVFHQYFNKIYKILERVSTKISNFIDNEYGLEAGKMNSHTINLRLY